MTKYRVTKDNYIIASSKSKPIHEKFKNAYELLDKIHFESREMRTLAKGLGCRKQFDDCPNRINKFDCTGCPFFPKKYFLKQNDKMTK